MRLCREKTEKTEKAGKGELGRYLWRKHGTLIFQEASTWTLGRMQDDNADRGLSLIAGPSHGIPVTERNRIKRGGMGPGSHDGDDSPTDGRGCIQRAWPQPLHRARVGKAAAPAPNQALHEEAPSGIAACLSRSPDMIPHGGMKRVRSGAPLLSHQTPVERFVTGGEGGPSSASLLGRPGWAASGCSSPTIDVGPRVGKPTRAKTTSASQLKNISHPRQIPTLETDVRKGRAARTSSAPSPSPRKTSPRRFQTPYPPHTQKRHVMPYPPANQHCRGSG